MGLGLFEEVVGDFTSGRVFRGILALDFHLEDFAGAFVGVDLCMSQECDEAFLEGVESAFDFACSLRGWSNEVGYTNGSQGALELAARVEVVV
jgi:hypothetical protein